MSVVMLCCGDMVRHGLCGVEMRCYGTAKLIFEKRMLFLDRYCETKMCKAGFLWIGGETMLDRLGPRSIEPPPLSSSFASAPRLYTLSKTY